MLELWLTALLTLNTPDHPKALSATTARTQIAPLAIARYGQRGWACLDRLIDRESVWNPNAKNPRSSARGLFQLLKLPAGLPVIRQYERGVRYLDARYAGSPCRALAAHGGRWY